MLALEEADDQADDDCNEDGKDGDRRILPAQESGRTDEDAASNVLHRGGAGVSGQNVPGEPGRENNGRQAADEQRQRIKLPSFQDPLLYLSRRMLAREHRRSSLAVQRGTAPYSRTRNNCGKRAPA